MPAPEGSVKTWGDVARNRADKIATWQQHGSVRPRLCSIHGIQYDGVLIINADRTGLHNPERYCERCAVLTLRSELKPLK